jgi:hypothetical protein
VILKVDGAFCQMVDVSDKFKPDTGGHRLLPKDDVDRIPVSVATVRRPKKARVDVDLECEI